MLSITDGGSPSRALDPTLRDLIELRCEQLRRSYDGPLEDIVNFLIVQPGDREPAVTAALGFSPLCNLVDQARFGDPGFTPSWEWIEQHGDWFEAAFILSDDGFGHILLVRDAETTDPELLSLCKAYIND